MRAKRSPGRIARAFNALRHAEVPQEPIPPESWISPRAGKLEEEVRFACVMYGGISLCVYMNGISDQLWRMVRATARSRAQEENDEDPWHQKEPLEPIDWVYRRLAELRSNAQDGRVTVRFVVDIISGTSAGGINGMFLAKALACEQSPTGLMNLWVSQGDFELLLNDSQHSDGIPLQNPPTSLLRSRMMAQRLLDALRGMGQDKIDQGKSNLVERLDLFMTASDLEGLDLSLELESDLKIIELRHKAVFHLVHDPDGAPLGLRKQAEGLGRSDFGDEFVPFLAFVSRCTSSIAPAFEPMQMNDVASLKDPGPCAYDPKSCPALFAPFFRDYWSNSALSRTAELFANEHAIPNAYQSKLAELQEERMAAFASRSFGDGGYGNNYPFNWAIDTLSGRRSELAVDRKLLVLDPNSSTLKPADGRPTPRPNLLDSMSAMAGVMKDQPIRDQIDRLRERNVLLERLSDLKSSFDSHTTIGSASTQSDAPEKNAASSAPDPALVVDPYYQLRVSAATRDLADLISAALGFEKASIYAEALNYLGGELTKLYLDVAGHSISDFLDKFDVSYQLRRLEYEVSEERDRPEKARISEAIRMVSQFRNYLVVYRALSVDHYKEFSSDQNTSEIGERLRNKLAGRQTPDLNQFIKLRAYFEDKKVTLPPARDLMLKMHEMRISIEDLQSIVIKNPLSKDRRKKASEILGTDENRPALAFCKAIADYFDPLLKHLRDASSADTGSFEKYDRWTFPAFYGNASPEAQHIDIVRVGPVDSVSLSGPNCEGKLAGEGMAHFSGFLHPAWRGEDILWGRLDAAERLICCILPKSCPDRELLLFQAHIALLLSTDVDLAVEAATRELKIDSRNLASAGDKVNGSMRAFRSSKLRLACKRFRALDLAPGDIATDAGLIRWAIGKASKAETKNNV